MRLILLLDKPILGWYGSRMEPEYTGQKWTLHTPFRNPITGEPLDASDIEEALATHFDVPNAKFDVSFEDLY